MMKDSYYEKQRFNQWWIWLMLIGLTLFSYYTCIQEVVYGNVIGSSGPSGNGAYLPPIIMSVITLLFMLFKLETRIDTEGIHVRFFPFHGKWRSYPWTSIKEASVREYRPLVEYGGWGLRGLGSNRALNVSGKTGIQLTFQNGDKLLIGTQNGDIVKPIIKDLLPFIPDSV
jgi:hypothetical protein